MIGRNKCWESSLLLHSVYAPNLTFLSLVFSGVAYACSWLQAFDHKNLGEEIMKVSESCPKSEGRPRGVSLATLS
jgi:hypothetical protein